MPRSGRGKLWLPTATILTGYAVFEEAHVRVTLKAGKGRISEKTR